MDRFSIPLFADGDKAVHFVLVYQKNILKPGQLRNLETFVENLLAKGLHAEVEVFSADRKINFIKIHASDDFIFRYATLCDIDLACRYLNYRPPKKPPPNFLATPLTKPNPNDEVYKRAPDSVSGEIPKVITSAERILVLFRFMRRLKYGEERSAYGLEKLLDDKILLDAFPVHDGLYQWTDVGPLNDRQLLARYWGNFKCFYKVQPLNLVEQYFGTEYSFYFAWCGHYTKYLIPVGIFSLLSVLYGLITVNTSLNLRSIEVCSSDIVLCAKCHYSYCHVEKLQDYCHVSHLVYIIDNPFNIFVAVVVAIWSTILMETWKRLEAELQLTWTTGEIEDINYIRPQYADTATKIVYSTVTGMNEYRTSIKHQMLRLTIVFTTFIMLVVIIITVTLGIMVYRMAIGFIMIDNATEKYKHHIHLFAVITGSTMSAFFMIFWHTVSLKICWWLTSLESHRTQKTLDNSFTVKLFVFNFTNNYTLLFYIAFFKGRFFTYPGDMSQWNYLGGLGCDICGPTGCTLDLAIQLGVIMTIQQLKNGLLQIILPVLHQLIMTVTKKKKTEKLQAYEIDYLMSKNKEYFLVREFTDLGISYGYVVFFVASFPIAPFLAMIANIMETRIDASKIIKYYRRPIPKRVVGIRPWLRILQGMTIFGVLTNGIVIAFTSDFVPRNLFKHKGIDDPTLGYMGTLLSAFDNKDFKIIRTVNHSGVCYYPGRRYPPNHEFQYQPTYDHWFLFALRLLVAILFEHVIIILTSLIMYAIPDIPTHVKEKLEAEERKNKNVRLSIMNHEYQKLLAQKRASVM